MEKYIKHAPLALFCLAIGKLLVFPATWEGAAAALVAAVLAAGYEFKNHDKKLLEMEANYDKKTKELEAKIEIITTVVNNHAKTIEDTKGSMSAMKLAQQIQSQKIAPNPVQRVF